MKRFAIALFACALAACAGGDPNNVGTTNSDTNGNADNSMLDCQDFDGDGFDGRSAGCNQGTDCDDNRAQVNPAAAENCTDRLDNDCSGVPDDGPACMMATCTDTDGDRYGTGSDCFGPDCNDNDAAINPSAMEICGNNIDEDCQNGDLACPENCMDNDRDGYGAAGSTDCVDANGMVLVEVDCDDNNAAINASANEVCDGADNNCNGQMDECPLAGQACDMAGGTCQGGAGAQCENADDCAGQFLTCDPSQNPKVCRVAENGPCQGVADCVNGLQCENNVCVGNFCANDPCSGGGIYGTCDRAAGICVECPHFEADEAVRDAECDLGQQCTPGGWCAYRDAICGDFSGDAFCATVFDEPPGQLPFETPLVIAPAELWWINWYMANCWVLNKEAGVKKMCSSFNVAGDLGTIGKDEVRAAYVDGDIDAELTMEENDALNDMWGEGLFNLEEVNWEEDVVAGSMGTLCLWYQPGGFLGGEAIVLDKCEDFTP